MTVTSMVWPTMSHLSLYLMKTWYSMAAPGAARASFSSFRKWVCTESSSYPKGKRKEEMGLEPGHRHRQITREERVAYMLQSRSETVGDYLLGKRKRGLRTCWLTSMLTKMVSIS